MTTPKSPQLFGLYKDFSFFKSITLEAGDLFMREIECGLVDHEATSVDPLYGDSKEVKYKTYRVRAQVAINPLKTELTKMGMHETRDLIVHIDKGALTRGLGSAVDNDNDSFSTENGGFPTPLEGDYFVVEGDKYRIVDAQLIDYYWHLEEHMTHRYFCNRLPDRAIDDSVVVDEKNPIGDRRLPEYERESYFPGEE